MTYMRSSKGTAQFLLAAFIIVALLAYLSAKDADRRQARLQQVVKATVKPPAVIR